MKSYDSRRRSTNDSLNHYDHREWSLRSVSSFNVPISCTNTSSHKYGNEREERKWKVTDSSHSGWVNHSYFSIRAIFYYSTIHTSSLEFVSEYSSQLNSYGLSYCRDSCSSDGSSYYYQPIQLIPSATATYKLELTSSIKIHAYLYQNNFNPSVPSANKLDGGSNYFGGPSFSLTKRLNDSALYIIVVTTERRYDSGPFTITHSGPAEIQFNRMSKLYSCYSRLRSVEFP